MSEEQKGKMEDSSNTTSSSPVGAKVNSGKKPKAKSVSEVTLKDEMDIRRKLPSRARTNVADLESTDGSSVKLSPRRRKKGKTKTNLGRSGFFKGKSSPKAGSYGSEFDDEDNTSKISEVTSKPLGKDTKEVRKKSKNRRQDLPKLPGKKQRKVQKIGSLQSNGSIMSFTKTRNKSKILKDSLAEINSQAIETKRSMSTLPHIDHEEIDREANTVINLEQMAFLEQHAPGDLLCGNFAYDDFDCFKRSDEDLISFFPEAFTLLGLSSLYNNDFDLIRGFMKRIKESYKPKELVPFHNFYHGFSVAQVAVAFMVRSTELKQLFDKKTIFTFIIGAACHDMDHPGNDNFYEVVINSSNAKMFEGKSVLEHHHTKATLEIMKENEGALNVLKYLTTNNQTTMLHLMVDLILATDMAQHKHHVEFLKELESVEELFDEARFEDRIKLLECLIHACDLSGQCFSTELAKTWEENIYFEMFNQFKRSKEKGVATPDHFKHFEEEGATLENRFKSQAGFLTYVLVPFWTEIARLFPEMEDFLDNLKRNRDYFEEQAGAC